MTYSPLDTSRGPIKGSLVMVVVFPSINFLAPIHWLTNGPWSHPCAVVGLCGFPPWIYNMPLDPLSNPGCYYYVWNLNLLLYLILNISDPFIPLLYPIINISYPLINEKIEQGTRENSIISPKTTTCIKLAQPSSLKYRSHNA